MNFDFLQTIDGDKSAKRLMGVSSGMVINYLAVFGGTWLVVTGNREEFIKLVEVMGVYSGGLLGLGFGEFLVKKKYASSVKIETPPSS